MPTVDALVLALAAADAPLSLVGGKGRSLMSLAAAGFPVPDGFVLTTRAYQMFVAANGLQPPIQDALENLDSGQPAAVVAARIQPLFESGDIPAPIVVAVERARAGLDAPAVAVRSSATVEDLPELSFAGQQESYLNVRDSAEVLSAIKRCWASLWSDRAVAYRQRHGVDPGGIAMGVIVQTMVPATVAGVAFTANPLNGERAEILINASFGLGEAVVSGQVTPDTVVLDRASLAPRTTIVGDKAHQIIAAAGEGTISTPVADAARQSLSVDEASLGELGKLCDAVESHFGGVPQDIEWACAQGRCWLLQARPITQLPPAPLRDVAWQPPTPGEKLVRRQVVENMPEPLSPLFEELYLGVGLEESIDQMIAGLAIPITIDDFVERPLFVTVNGYAYCRASYHVSWRLLGKIPPILWWYATALPRFVRTMVSRWRDEGLPAYLRSIERWRAVDAAAAPDAELIRGIRALAVADGVYWFNVAMAVGMAKITDWLLNGLVSTRAFGEGLTSGAFLRGFPSKTLEAQETLEALALRVRDDASVCAVVVGAPAAELLTALGESPAGAWALAEIQRYLDTYGHQIYNLDFAQPTQAEAPLPVLLSLRSLVENPGYDTPTRQAEMLRERETLIRDTRERLGPLRRRLFSKLLGWAQRYGPYREEALFYMGAGWPALRGLALELGGRLARSGALEQADDVFYLRSAELARAGDPVGQSRADFARLARERRELRAARQRLHPPGMVPVGSRYRFGPIDATAFETQKRNLADARVLKGFAVSPGKVSGCASVIHSPADFAQMQPDTILVCPTTTPAWTPLFGQACGLVTDIGGILAHGSIVAREYGIPAVLGTGDVTRRIVSGQRISVDGDRGTVSILD